MRRVVARHNVFLFLLYTFIIPVGREYSS